MKPDVAKIDRQANICALLFAVFVVFMIVVAYFPDFRKPFIAPFNYLCDTIDQQSKVDMTQLNKDTSPEDRQRTIDNMKGDYHE